MNPNRLWVAGWSLGSEAALLVAVHYGGTWSSACPFSPNDVADCSLDAGSPIWTLGGKAVPCTNGWDDPRATDNPAAVIPVAKFRGPVFLDCGGADTLWSSCCRAG